MLYLANSYTAAIVAVLWKQVPLFAPASCIYELLLSILAMQTRMGSKSADLDSTEALQHCRHHQDAEIYFGSTTKTEVWQR
ncbi:hypothetical protein F441_05122 [Phytophthora nicotianae CJ01A1]|uniref:Uncharacterized protein n=3 Tax=Phytophthora nicotianae TaxID=4792 RepID=V9FL65_PHYNI|nr:hypothetical protein F443_05122 [Phytophthora nicotianae P1569]ETO80284.1 hypothetical protein F444_05159 [Phytophthora nicotianae P1976]ETP21311.1 hypothetical protein F441_05122 [Phytophthora nicotianae CJ01A1]